MNHHFFRLALLGTLAFGCSDQAFTEPTAGSGRLRIEMPCTSDAACPAQFECESETEHGVTTSFCQSHDEAKPDGTGAQCPTGFELEVEHGTSFCKPHGGDSDDSGRGRDDSSADSSGSGGSDDRGVDDHGGGEAGDDHGGGEAGDDHGGADESGDDHGQAGEAGDDRGRGGEGGDDHGSSGHG